MRRLLNPLQPIFVSIALLLLTLGPAFGGAARVSAAHDVSLKIHLNNIRLCNNRCALIVNDSGLTAGSLHLVPSSSDSLDLTIHINNVRLCNNRCTLIVKV
jgi:hypothetical protein